MSDCDSIVGCGFETDLGSDCETMLGCYDDEASHSFVPRIEHVESVKLSDNRASMSPEAAQQQLDVMSETVMNIWSTLTTLQTQIEDQPSKPEKRIPWSQIEDQPTEASAQCGLCLDACVDSAFSQEGEKQQCVKQTLSLEGLLDMESAIKGPEKTRLTSKARLFKPTERRVDERAEIDAVLESARLALIATPGVAAVEIQSNIVGSVKTLCVTLFPGSWDAAHISIPPIAKAALLEATSSSKNVYILGYEVKPFEETANEMDFAAVLAIAPQSWECVACWETYQEGACPRGPSCRWQHPGRDEIQPLRVVFQ